MTGTEQLPDSVIDCFERKQKEMDKQVRGLKSFATQVERQSHALQVEEPQLRMQVQDMEAEAQGKRTNVPAPPIPSETSPTPDVQPTRATHFNPVRSEVHAGAIRIDVSDPEQCSGGLKRALEIYRRVEGTTKKHPWSAPTTEETWHAHAEGVSMVALTNLNLPAEAWKSARLLRAVPNCRLALMLAYHMLSPALCVEEAGLMTFFNHLQMQAHQWFKCPQDCKAGSVLEGDWLRLAADYLLPPSFIKHLAACVPAKVKHHAHDEPQSI